MRGETMRLRMRGQTINKSKRREHRAHRVLIYVWLRREKSGWVGLGKSSKKVGGKKWVHLEKKEQKSGPGAIFCFFGGVQLVLVLAFSGAVQLNTPSIYLTSLPR